MSKAIICRKCRREITSREDLVVAGNSFVPMHRRCHTSSRGTRFLLIPVNGVLFLALWAGIDLALLLTWLFLSPDRNEMLTFAAFFNLVFGATRLFCYLCFESHLPRKTSGQDTDPFP